MGALRAILGMGVALLSEHLVKKSDFGLPEHVFCSPVVWPRWLLEGSHDLVLQ